MRPLIERLRQIVERGDDIGSRNLAMMAEAADELEQSLSKLDALSKFPVALETMRVQRDDALRRLGECESELRGARFTLAALCKENPDGTLYLRRETLANLSPDASIERTNSIDGSIHYRVVERGSTNSELPVLARIERDDGSSTTIYDGPNTPSE